MHGTASLSLKNNCRHRHPDFPTPVRQFVF